MPCPLYRFSKMSGLLLGEWWKCFRPASWKCKTFSCKSFFDQDMFSHNNRRSFHPNSTISSPSSIHKEERQRRRRALKASSFVCLTNETFGSRCERQAEDVSQGRFEGAWPHGAVMAEYFILGCKIVADGKSTIMHNSAILCLKYFMFEQGDRGGRGKAFVDIKVGNFSFAGQL